MTEPGSWAALDRELDAWRAEGRAARFWLRDDDATAPGDALDRLLGVVGSRPLALAVIPGAMDPALVSRMAGAEQVDILPHGWLHRNHEPEGVKKSEFGAARKVTEAVADLKEGGRVLKQAFGARYIALFVPPWNRIAPDVADLAVRSGMTGISAFNDRRRNERFPGLNTHVDLLDWGWKKSTGSARFAGSANCLAALTGALARRRLGHADADGEEAVGILTHHLEHDAETWDFMTRLLGAIDQHPAATWVAARDAIRIGNGDGDTAA